MEQRVLVIGGNGMLGNAFQFVSGIVPVFVVRSANQAASTGFPNVEIFSDWLDFESAIRFVERQHIDVIVNCAGCIDKQASLIDLWSGNVCLPMVLSEVGKTLDLPLIQISTDCVFAGTKGRYADQDMPDPADLYGWTKFKGEKNKSSMVIRTSIVGRSLEGKKKQGLLDWFLNINEGDSIFGYRNAYFSGLSTIRLAQIVADLINKNAYQTGVFHLPGPIIDKCSLLYVFKNVFDRNVEIIEVDSPIIDRSLVPSDYFDGILKYYNLTWPEMCSELRQLYRG